jgi:hypothetical protein
VFRIHYDLRDFPLGWEVPVLLTEFVVVRGTVHFLSVSLHIYHVIRPYRGAFLVMKFSCFIFRISFFFNEEFDWVRYLYWFFSGLC